MAQLQAVRQSGRRRCLTPRRVHLLGPCRPSPDGGRPTPSRKAICFAQAVCLHVNNHRGLGKNPVQGYKQQPGECHSFIHSFVLLKENVSGDLGHYVHGSWQSRH